MLGWVVRSFISSHGDFTRESLEILCTTALDVVLLSRDDRFAQVRHLSPLVSQDPLRRRVAG